MSRYPFPNPTQDHPQLLHGLNHNNSSNAAHFQEGHHHPESTDWDQSRNPKVRYNMYIVMVIAEARKKESKQ
jgi:hypothetical protein